MAEFTESPQEYSVPMKSIKTVVKVDAIRWELDPVGIPVPDDAVIEIFDGPKKVCSFKVEDVPGPKAPGFYQSLPKPISVETIDVKFPTMIAVVGRTVGKNAKGITCFRGDGHRQGFVVQTRSQ